MIGLLMQLNVLSAGWDEKSIFYQILSNELLSVVQSQSTEYNLEKLNCSFIQWFFNRTSFGRFQEQLIQTF